MVDIKRFHQAQFTEQHPGLAHTHPQSIACHGYMVAMLSEHLASKVVPELDYAERNALLHLGLHSGMHLLDSPAEWQDTQEFVHRACSGPSQGLGECVLGVSGQALMRSPLVYLHRAAKILDAISYVRLNGTVNSQLQKSIIQGLFEGYAANIADAQQCCPELAWRSLNNGLTEFLSGPSGLLLLDMNQPSDVKGLLGEAFGLTVKDMARAQYLDRWHTVMTLKSQNLSSHQAGSTMLGLHMQALVMPDATDKQRWELSDYLLTHDLDELISGDGNGAFRAYMRQVDPVVMERTQGVLDRLYPEGKAKRECVEGTPSKYFAKLADILDASAFIHDFGGPDAEMQTAISLKLDEFYDNTLAKANAAFPSLDWSKCQQIREQYLYRESYSADAALKLGTFDMLQADSDHQPISQMG
ncbi:hypothetical protein [Aliagarivorans taiwanensis]|uniref:hypothetical protein n=1 Tax=Aliagarivorans taiwanensis TaxID=561966 RepID=UPI00055906F1|nr:hypothetical protein [Aliagarivorans taiwanensis]